MQADTERFERDNEYEGCAEREAQENAETWREIMAPVEAAAERAASEMIRRKLVDRFIPGAPTPLGFEAGRNARDECISEQILSDVRGAFLAWLPDDVKALVEE